MLYLYNVSVPPFAYNTLLANIGSMRNSGTEIALGDNALKNKDLELNINAHITFQQNKLLSPLSGSYNGESIFGSRIQESDRPQLAPVFMVVTTISSIR